jgi:hypothetical protein
MVLGMVQWVEKENPRNPRNPKPRKPKQRKTGPVKPMKISNGTPAASVWKLIGNNP